MWKLSSSIRGPTFFASCIGSGSWRCSSTSGSCWWDISISGRKGRWTGIAQPYAGTALRDGDTRLEKNPNVARIRAWRPEAISQLISFRGELTLVVPREHLRPLAEFLAGESDLAFSYLSDVTGVDRFPVEPRFELNYHLLSISRRDSLRLRVRLPGEDAVIESVVPIWPTANWHEREIFDLFGIRFEGHPDLRRLLMPEDWEGYPLRKDYPVEGPR